MSQTNSIKIISDIIPVLLLLKYFFAVVILFLFSALLVWLICSYALKALLWLKSHIMLTKSNSKPYSSAYSRILHSCIVASKNSDLCFLVLLSGLVRYCL